MKKKVTVIGAGNVGATAAMRVAEKELANVVLIDILEGVPAGKALDLTEAAPIEKHDSAVIGVTADYDKAKDSDTIITAGIPITQLMAQERINAPVKAWLYYDSWSLFKDQNKPTKTLFASLAP